VLRRAEQPIDLVPHSFGCIVQRGEVALLICRGASLIHHRDDRADERHGIGCSPPLWSFVCPGCRKRMMMHTHHGPGTPGTDLAAPLPRQRFSFNPQSVPGISRDARTL